MILATSVAEKLHQYFSEAEIDFLLKKGNETLLSHHPFINEVITWDKKSNKFTNLLKLISIVRKKKYDVVINLHRFASSGFITGLSGAKEKIGFDKNPFSFLFTKKFKHEIGNGKHEIERNHELIKSLSDDVPARPRLYPDEKEKARIMKIRESNGGENQPYVCIAPASVWFTKQFPKEKWIELINHLPETKIVYLLGSKEDQLLGDDIISFARNPESGSIKNLAGQLSFLESAQLMKDAEMNYVNDSAPMHLASAVNAPVTAIFCSTIPGFGFGPLSDHSRIVETKIKLDCRPCGLHGFRSCPEKHFKCALAIEIKDLLPT